MFIGLIKLLLKGVTVVKRKKQLIICIFGKRTIYYAKLKKWVTDIHKGVDLRSWNLLIWKRQKIVFPERSKVLRINYQENWGWIVVFKPLEYIGLTEIKFHHLQDPLQNIKIGVVYDKGDLIGKTGQTEFMKENKLGEHLHVETKNGREYKDPLIYFDDTGADYAYKKKRK